MYDKYTWCRALANNFKCQDNMSLHALKWLDMVRHFISGQSQSYIHVQ